jgi:hypothetical protein
MSFFLQDADTLQVSLDFPAEFNQIHGCVMARVAIYYTDISSPPVARHTLTCIT